MLWKCHFEWDVTFPPGVRCGLLSLMEDFSLQYLAFCFFFCSPVTGNLFSVQVNWSPTLSLKEWWLSGLVVSFVFVRIVQDVLRRCGDALIFVYLLICTETFYHILTLCAPASWFGMSVWIVIALFHSIWTWRCSICLAILINVNR